MPLKLLGNYTAISRIDPHLLLLIFLPALLFESAFVMDIHTFRKMFWQVSDQSNVDPSKYFDFWFSPSVKVERVKNSGKGVGGVERGQLGSGKGKGEGE